MANKIHGKHGGYGWIPQKPDQRDHEFLPTVARQRLPSQYVVDASQIPVLDQGQQGSCTGHGTAGLVMVDQKKQGEEVVVPARAFIYFNARDYEGTADQDSGAEVRDAVKGIVNLGVPPDNEFPYNDQVYDVRAPDNVYADAINQVAKTYEAAHYGHLDQVLASGFPFTFGFTVYESFESDEVAQTGVVPIPERGEQVLGGHCVWCWGYNSSYSRSWTAPNGKILPPRVKACRNSWSDGWGDYGDFYLPQWYFDNGQCSDYWVIRSIS